METSVAPLSVLRSSRQKLSKYMDDLSNTIIQHDLTDFIPNNNIDILSLCSGSHGTVTKTEHSPGHKTHLNEFKTIVDHTKYVLRP